VLILAIRIAAVVVGIAGAALAGLYLARDHLPTAQRVRISGLVHRVWVDHSIKVPMQDGVALAASLYTPIGRKGPWPTVLIRMPYGRLYYGEGFNYGLYFAKRGYAVLVQDIRGKYDSGGAFAPWRKSKDDGVATLDWIAAQPWSTGKVGTVGCSALGELQLTLSRANHPAHQAMIPIDAGGGAGFVRGHPAPFGLFEGGVLQLASAFGWYVEHGYASPTDGLPANLNIKQASAHLPVSEMLGKASSAPNAFDYLWKIPLGSPDWALFDFVMDVDKPAKPTLLINTWGDQSIDGALAYAQHITGNTPSGKDAGLHVILAPGNHCQLEETGESGKFGDIPVANATQPYKEWFLRWFDYWLKGEGNGLADLPRYLYYVIGEAKWLGANAWPPEYTKPQRWYLDSGGKAHSARGDGVLATSEPAGAVSFDEFVSDPAKPVPSVGGPVCCTGDPADRAGPLDQALVEARDDVLVYTSAPLQAPLRIAGPLRARVAVSSTAKDTDLIGRLVHVWPDGKATNIQEGALRLRYREGFAAPSLLEPGKPVEVTVSMRSIAYTLPAGHRLRLHLASSSFPRLERNLQNGAENPHQESMPNIARNRVFHGAGLLSYLELPVIEDAQAVTPAAP
jgi:putative CocE/NonD family hydrolase